MLAPGRHCRFSGKCPIFALIQIAAICFFQYVVEITLLIHAGGGRRCVFSLLLNRQCLPQSTFVLLMESNIKGNLISVRVPYIADNNAAVGSVRISNRSFGKRILKVAASIAGSFYIRRQVSRKRLSFAQFSSSICHFHSCPPDGTDTPNPKFPYNCSTGSY